MPASTKVDDPWLELVQTFAQATWETDSAGVVVSDSPSWRAFTGQSLAEWMGNHWADAVHWEDREYVQSAWIDCLTKKCAFDAQFRLRHVESGPEGFQWTHALAVPVRDAEGGVAKWVGMNLQTDPVSPIENALRMSETKYRSLFESIDEGFTIVEAVRDSDGELIDLIYREANPTYAQHIGFQPYPGLRVKESAPEIDADWMKYYDRVSRTGVQEKKEGYNANLRRWYRTQCSRVGPVGSPLLAIVWEDITERKLAEMVLRENEERQTFLLALSDALRPLSDVEKIRRSACSLLGEHLKASRTYYVEFFPEQDSAVVGEDYASSGLPSLAGTYSSGEFGTTCERISAGRTWVVSDVHRAADLADAERGRYAAQAANAWVIVPQVKEGKLEAALCVVQNEARTWSDEQIRLVENVAERLWVSVRRGRTETALRENEQRLEIMMQSVPSGIAMIDINGRYTYANEAWRELIPNAHIPSRDPKIVAQWRGWHEDGTLWEPWEYPAARALRGEFVLPGVEMLHTAEDGKETWMSIRAVPHIDSDGKVVGAFCAVSDIDFEKRAALAVRDREQRLRALASVIFDATYRMSPEWDRMYELVGDEFLQDWKGGYASWMDHYIPLDERDRVMAAIQESVANGSSFDLEHRVVTSDGSIGWVHSRAIPVRNDEGKVCEWIGATVDITERKSIEAALRLTLGETQTELQALTAHLLTAQDEERRRIAGDLHDDLGQRVALVGLQAGLLERASRDALTQEGCDILDQLKLQVTELSKQIREVAHALQPAIIADLGLPFALRALVEEHQKAGATLNLHIAECPVLPVDAATAFYRIAQEALSNSTKHATGASVHIYLGCEDGGTDYLVMRITDEGNGFDPTKTRGKGGLGLVSMLQRARAIQAEFDIVTHPGDGTTVIVRFRLPKPV